METSDLINEYYANIISDIRALEVMLDDIRDDRQNPYRIHAAQIILEHMHIKAHYLESVIKEDLGGI